MNIMISPITPQKKYGEISDKVDMYLTLNGQNI